MRLEKIVNEREKNLKNTVPILKFNASDSNPRIPNPRIPVVLPMPNPGISRVSTWDYEITRNYLKQYF